MPLWIGDQNGIARKVTGFNVGAGNPTGNYVTGPNSNNVYTLTITTAMEVYENSTEAGSMMLQPGVYEVAQATSNVRPNGSDPSSFYSLSQGGKEYLVRKTDIVGGSVKRVIGGWLGVDNVARRFYSIGAVGTMIFPYNVVGQGGNFLLEMHFDGGVSPYKISRLYQTSRQNDSQTVTTTNIATNITVNGNKYTRLLSYSTLAVGTVKRIIRIYADITDTTGITTTVNTGHDTHYMSVSGGAGGYTLSATVSGRSVNITINFSGSPSQSMEVTVFNENIMEHVYHGYQNTGTVKQISNLAPGRYQVFATQGQTYNATSLGQTSGTFIIT